MDIPYFWRYLNIIDTLNTFSEFHLDLNLLRIVIIGIQSAGKSSVIESISDLEMPRNEGVGTKAPIQLCFRKLRRGEETCRIKYGDDPETEWRYIEFNEVNSTVRTYQNNLIGNTGSNNDSHLSNKLITLEVHKRNLSDLTIIDLPGLTHINPETEQLVKDLVTDYIKQPNTIVLFAHNATMDFVADECLTLITEVSKNTPPGEVNILDRTIPLLTKIDIASSEQLIKNIKDCKNYKFKYSPILIRNSSKGNEINDTNYNGGYNNNNNNNNNGNAMFNNNNNNNNNNNDNNNNENNNNDSNNKDNKRRNNSEEYQNNRKNILNNERRIEENIINERLRNQTLRSLCSNYQGINGLTKLLLEIESDYLHNSKTEVKDKINKILEYCKEEKSNFPKAIENKYEFFERFNNIKDEFSKLLKDKFENRDNLLPNENFKGENFEYSVETKIRLQYEKFRAKFNKYFYNYLSMNYYHQMKYIVDDSIELNFPDFFGEKVIYKILSNSISKYFDYVPDLISEIQKNINKVVEEVFNSTFNEYVNVFDSFVTISQQKLTELEMTYSENCKKGLKELEKNEMKTLYIGNKNYLLIGQMIFQRIQHEISLLENNIIDIDDEDDDIIGGNNRNNNNGNEDINEEHINDDYEEETYSDDDFEQEEYETNQNSDVNHDNSDSETIKVTNEESSNENDDSAIINNIIEKVHYKFDFNKNINIEAEFFFNFTGLDKKYYKTFVRDIYNYKKENKNINWSSIRIMCSIYSYLKLYMDRILDNVNKEIIIDLLLPFKEGTFIRELSNIFISMSETELLELMEINEDTTLRLDEINDKIERFEEASRILDSINRRVVHNKILNIIV